MTIVLAIPILAEWPTAIDWVAIILISAGVYVVKRRVAVRTAEVGGGTIGDVMQRDQ
jgi:drug/metabolite transporter (DMT)-like permease